MQVLYFFSRQNLQTFDITHAFLSLTIAKLSTLKNGPVFWPTLYMLSRANNVISIQYINSYSNWS